MLNAIGSQVVRVDRNCLIGFLFNLMADHSPTTRLDDFIFSV
jgi:hypothetical protein